MPRFASARSGSTPIQVEISAVEFGEAAAADAFCPNTSLPTKWRSCSFPHLASAWQLLWAAMVHASIAMLDYSRRKSAKRAKFSSCAWRYSIEQHSKVAVSSRELRDRASADTLRKRSSFSSEIFCITVEDKTHQLDYGITKCVRAESPTRKLREWSPFHACVRTCVGSRRHEWNLQRRFWQRLASRQ
mmetsp:Transcript_49628/g.131566  ORF Transcript_49628/g.131566 Transcript_49628/m.131566 type:complete len:188 (+) Transcript_49628:1240-1803(+)